MNRIICFLVLAFGINLPAQVGNVSLSQAIARPAFLLASPVQPVDKAILNQNQIMFDYPVIKGAVTYIVSVYRISAKTPLPDSKKDTIPVFSQQDSTNATLIVGFEFGQEYSWTYTAYNKSGKEITRSKHYSFSILPLPHKYRINVLKNDKKGQGGMVSFDYAHIICDRSGQIVWFLNPIKGQFTESELIRDLRINRAGTVTFLSTKHIYETTIDGRILWKAPDANQITGGTGDFYHHGFERLPSGNYFTMGTRHEMRSVPNDTAHVLVEYGTLLEFNRMGKVVWSWDSKSFLTDADIFKNKTPEGQYDTDAHLNAFDLDDSAKYVYAGFRNLNNIVKIEKKTGQVVANYDNGFFWHQHDANILPDNSIAVFNNDSIADPKKFSSVVIFSQPKKADELPKVIWKFSCKFDTLSKGKSEKGGDVELLPNGNYLVNMGTLHRCIELNKSKKLIWDAFVEEWVEEQKVWAPVRQYRAHYVSSLYPCYFTANAFADTISGNPKQIIVNIHNEGSEADSYYVDSKLKSEFFTNSTIPVSIPAGTNNSIILPEPAKGKQITEVRVRSAANPDFVRVIILN